MQYVVSPDDTLWINTIVTSSNDAKAEKDVPVVERIELPETLQLTTDLFSRNYFEFFFSSKIIEANKSFQEWIKVENKKNLLISVLLYRLP